MRKKRVYIAGKITGVPDYMEKFAQAEEKLLSEGIYDVINPAKVTAPLPQLEHYEYMKLCLPMVELSDIVYLLPGWRQSKGACLERQYAQANEKDIIYPTDTGKINIMEILDPADPAYHSNSDAGAAFDIISNPAHYTEGRKHQPKDVIRDWGLNYNLGCTVKYISRAGRKESAIEDLKKAQEYLQFEIDALEAESKGK